MELLLTHGATFNSRTVEQLTPLHLACQYNHKDVRREGGRGQRERGREEGGGREGRGKREGGREERGREEGGRREGGRKGTESYDHQMFSVAGCFITNRDRGRG